MHQIIKTCYQKSIRILKDNSTRFGVLASGYSPQAKERNYLSIFGRDASLCSLGMVVSGERGLISSARHSLETLAKYQADNGQIPFYVKPEKKQSSFYYLGCLDSTLWWLIAIKFFSKNTSYNLEVKLKASVKKALNWLACQEHPGFYLLQQNEASDWADLMPRSGFVLYSNALWYWVKKLYNLKNQQETKDYFNYIFGQGCPIPKKVIQSNHRLKGLLKSLKKEPTAELYRSFVNYSFCGLEGDVFGNILACLFGLANDQKVEKIIDYFLKNKANKPYPVKSVIRPIRPKAKLWREYMSKHGGINKPWQYHNGGLWPFIGGFWVILLSMIDNKLAVKELEALAKLNQKNNWQFNEWFHGQSARPRGMPKQSWNAAMYLLAGDFLNFNKN